MTREEREALWRSIDHAYAASKRLEAAALAAFGVEGGKFWRAYLEHASKLRQLAAEADNAATFYLEEDHEEEATSESDSSLDAVASRLASVRA